MSDTWDGRFTSLKHAEGATNLTIKIVAQNDRPAFAPSIITGSPGQVIHLTVLQNNDLSAQFQHNFSIDSLGINKDIPLGAGHHISLTITLPQTGALTFYCAYHVVAEQHAGEFLVTP